MNVWAIVPVKPLNRAKSRLAGVLSPEVREQLAMAMLSHTLTTLEESRAVGGVLVISRDSRALVLARKYGAKTVQESGAPELNSALQRAGQVIASWNAQASLVLPADLPLLAPTDVGEIVELGRYQQSVVIVPDRAGEGTNAILMHPPGLFSFMFGPASFQRHLAAANAAGATVHVYRSERVMLDLDTPDDLATYLVACNEQALRPLIELSADSLLLVESSQKEKP